jgi:hypothetical protein
MADTGSTHPRVRRRTTRDEPALRVIVFAPDTESLAWIETEVERIAALLQHGRNIEHVISALVEDPPPRPQVLIVDFDAISGGDLMQLHSIRERGWFGTIIGLGYVPPPLRASLSIDHVLRAPFALDSLAGLIRTIGFSAATVRMPVLSRPDVTFRARSAPKARVVVPGKRATTDGG